MSQNRLISFSLTGLAMVVLVLIQVSLVTVLPQPWSWVQLPLVAMWFLVLVIDYPLGLWATLIGGVVWEWYSPLPWGGLVLPLLAVMVLANMQFKAVFTNRSLFSVVVLAFAGTWLWYILNGLWNVVAWWLGQTAVAATLDWFLVRQHLGQSSATVVVLAAVFMVMRLFTKRGQSVFLIGGRR